MGQHAEGPWRIDWNISRLDIFAAGGQLIARLLRSTKDGAPTYDDAEAIANARLIAAAPDLLECLENAAMNATGERRARYLAAIAKAQGSQQ